MSDEKKFHILCAEDNPADRVLIKEFLVRGHPHLQITFADDGVEAWEILSRSGAHGGAPRPDLIMLDLNLRRVDGREVLWRVKSSPELRQIPVLILSTSANQQDVRDAYDHHANCYLVKPQDLDCFESVMAQIRTFWTSTVERIRPEMPAVPVLAASSDGYVSSTKSSLG